VKDEDDDDEMHASESFTDEDEEIEMLRVYFLIFFSLALLP
jgi:hypothetical protein